MSKASIDLKSLGDSSSEDISALSCVFRAGRENALTDHSSILFDVDLNTGKIKKGSSNDNWYRIGLGNILTCPWRTNDEDQRVNSHPDVAEGGVIEGKKILQIEEMKDLVERSHAKMCPDVPFVGRGHRGKEDIADRGNEGPGREVPRENVSGCPIRWEGSSRERRYCRSRK